MYFKILNSLLLKLSFLSLTYLKFLFVLNVSSSTCSHARALRARDPGSNLGPGESFYLKLTI